MEPAGKGSSDIDFSRQRPAIPRGVRILGSGRYLPGPPRDNRALVTEFGLDTTPEWIREHIGIEQRHIADAETATSDIAAAAARIALEDAGLAAGDLDHILLCTTTGDWTSPAAACRVQDLLGARCPAEDKQSACASFLYGLDHGARLVATGLETVLVIGADLKSRFTDPADRRLFSIFADGAGAMVLGRGEPDGGFVACELWADGSLASNLYTPAGGSALPASADTVRDRLHTVRMFVDGKRIFDDAVRIMTELSRQVCRQYGVAPSRIDCFIPHQANKKIMSAVGRNLEIAPEKIVSTIEHTGNITSGTIPYAFDFAVRERLLAPGSLVLMTAAGAGYAGGAVLYRHS